jgi:hypothetical protein
LKTANKRKLREGYNITIANESIGFSSSDLAAEDEGVDEDVVEEVEEDLVYPLVVITEANKARILAELAEGLLPHHFPLQICAVCDENVNHVETFPLLDFPPIFWLL